MYFGYHLIKMMAYLVLYMSKKKTVLNIFFPFSFFTFYIKSSNIKPN